MVVNSVTRQENTGFYIVELTVLDMDTFCKTMVGNETTLDGDFQTIVFILIENNSTTGAERKQAIAQTAELVAQYAPEKARLERENAEQCHKLKLFYFFYFIYAL
jgi:hypothetical protein